MSRSIRAFGSLLALALVAACGDGDGSGPDEFNPALLIGTYGLSPAPAATCDLNEFGTATLTIDTVEVTDADEDGISLRLPVRIATSLIDTRQEVFFTLPFDADDRSFGGATVIDVDIPATITTVHADGDLSIDGDFETVDSFQASILSDIDVALGDEAATPCSSVDIDVTGTRLD